ncbi:MAG TPA: hypothetical protein VMF69_17990 [Gemmataceae bacterium]|nr:hypothetical protein [Gemmataceae bacterium]
MKRAFSAACLLLLGLSNFVQADQGNPKIKAIEAIAFGPKGLLLIGGGDRVVAVETGDTSPSTWSVTEVANIDGLLAGKLGLDAKDIEVRKLAVNPASHKAYVALQSLKSKDNVILTIDGAGQIAEFPLDNVKYTSYALAMPNASITKVTDIAWADGKIVASTQATDKFRSRVFTINPDAKDGAPKQISTKTFHTGHNKWETQAPLAALTAYLENGKSSVVGTFTCTPIVRYDLEDANNDDQITGRSVVELGQGNTPLDMFSYEREGKKYILICCVTRGNRKSASGFPSAYWVARVDADLLKETTNINEKAPWRIDVPNKAKAGDRVLVAKEFFGARQMDQLDATRALAIVEGKGGLTLRALPLP